MCTHTYEHGMRMRTRVCPAESEMITGYRDTNSHATFDIERLSACSDVSRGGWPKLTSDSRVPRIGRETLRRDLAFLRKEEEEGRRWPRNVSPARYFT